MLILCKEKLFWNLHSLRCILIEISQDFNQNPYPADCFMPRYVKSSRGYLEMEWLGGQESSALCGLCSANILAPAVTASLPQEYHQIIGGQRGNIRHICIWQIKNENEQWSCFVFADLQQQDNLKDNISVFPSNIIWECFSDLSFLVKIFLSVFQTWVHLNAFWRVHFLFFFVLLFQDSWTNE